MIKKTIYFIGLLFILIMIGSTSVGLAAEEASTMMCDEGVVNIGATGEHYQFVNGFDRF